MARYVLERGHPVAVIPPNDISTILNVAKCRSYFVSLYSINPFTLIVQNVQYKASLSGKFYRVMADQFSISNSNKYSIESIVLDDTKFKVIKWNNGVKLSYHSDMDIELLYDYIIDTKTKPKKKAEVDDVKIKWKERQVELANKVWKEVRESLDNEEFKKLSDKDQVKFFQNKFQNFNKQHPIPLRYMVQFSLFRTRAFERYIGKVSETRFGDQDAFLERQADYVALLWKECNPKWKPDEAKLIWKEAYDTIKMDSDLYKKSHDKAKELADLVDSKYNHELRVELNNHIEDIRKLDDFKKAIHVTSRERHINKILANEISDSSDEEPDFNQV